jgi:hypothetical protein
MSAAETQYFQSLWFLNTTKKWFMITIDQARQIAEKKLQELQSKSNTVFALLKDCISFEYGWIFFYQSEKYVKTADPEFLLGGNAPILVDRETGYAFITGTRHDTNYYIETYSSFKKAWI